MSKLFRAVVKVVKVQSYTDFPLSANISCHSKKVPRTMPQRHKCEFKKKVTSCSGENKSSSCTEITE